jgi:hypothetical protein
MAVVQDLSMPTTQGQIRIATSRDDPLGTGPVHDG